MNFSFQPFHFFFSFIDQVPHAVGYLSYGVFVGEFLPLAAILARFQKPALVGLDSFDYLHSQSSLSCHAALICCFIFTRKFSTDAHEKCIVLRLAPALAADDITGSGGQNCDCVVEGFCRSIIL